MELTSLVLSVIAIVISSIVAFLHFRRDQRESNKFQIEKDLNTKKVAFYISEINYSFDRTIDEITNDVAEDHIVYFDLYIQNRGIPTIFLDKVGVISTKPLLGEKIKSFTFNVPENQNKLDAGKKYQLRFGEAFESHDLAYQIINSHIKIKCLDLQGQLFSSNLIKPVFGDSI